MKLWHAAVFIGLGMLVVWLIWGRKPPPPAKPVVEIHTDTVLRKDTAEVVPPVILAKLSDLRHRLAAFVAETTYLSDTGCIMLLAAANAFLDSLQTALAQKPSVKLLVYDSLTAKWPLKALWVALRYEASGDSAGERWEYRQWPASIPSKNRLGAIFNYGTKQGGGVGLQLRLDQSKAIQTIKTEKGWSFGMVWFLL